MSFGAGMSTLPGGRVSIESKLPGLASWARVRDYRTNLVQTRGNVNIYRGINDSLYQQLNSDTDRITNAGIKSLQNIGDCRAPGAIAHAVYSGHECARNIDAGDSIETFAWERARLS